MSAKPVRKQHAAWGLIAIMVVMAGAAVYVVKVVLSDDHPREKDKISIVTLVKPPPPEEIKQKPPEVREVPKKEEIISTPQDADQSKGPDKDNTPAGENLGVDAEGTAGSDAFGLVGKKGGRSLLAGGGSGGNGMGRLSLLSKYATYNVSLQNEIYKRVMKRADEEGWFPKGKFQTGVQIKLSNKGAIVSFKIIGSSGNHKWDDLIDEVLGKGNLRFTPPPEEILDKTIVIRISCQG